jgi:hypothetical protein
MCPLPAPLAACHVQDTAGQKRALCSGLKRAVPRPVPGARRGACPSCWPLAAARAPRTGQPSPGSGQPRRHRRPNMRCIAYGHAFITAHLAAAPDAAPAAPAAPPRLADATPAPRPGPPPPPAPHFLQLWRAPYVAPTWQAASRCPRASIRSALAADPTAATATPRPNPPPPAPPPMWPDAASGTPFAAAPRPTPLPPHGVAAGRRWWRRRATWAVAVALVTAVTWQA